MRALPTALLIVSVLRTSHVLARGDGTFVAPLVLPSGPNVVWAAAADFSGDGATDIAAVNGTSEIAVILQDPTDRTRWNAAPPVRAGNGDYHIIAADLDGDGHPDLAVADPGSSTYIILSHGDGTFEPAVALPDTSNSRVVAAADLDRDGKVDVVSVDSFTRFSIHLGLGGGNFRFLRGYAAQNCHDMLVLDFDGDGFPDIMAKTKETGIFPFRGTGDGTFDALPLIDNLTVRGPIATGDFDGDGRGDLMTDYGPGLSLGDGTYRKVFETDRPFMPVCAADINSDGRIDALVTELDRRTLEVHPGRGDGTFDPPISIDLGGEVNAFHITDLDGDGRGDLVISGFSGLSVLWGRGGERSIAAPLGISGLPAAKAIAIGDVDLDGMPDLLVPSTRDSEVWVFPDPARSEPGPPRVLDTTRFLSAVECADLDGDGVPDLVGVDPVDRLVALFLDASGAIRSETVLVAGTLPTAIALGRIDEDERLDVAVSCAASGEVALFLGTPGGGFQEAPRRTTFPVPRDVAIADLDGDGVPDLLVTTSGGGVIHWGRGSAEFNEGVPLETHSEDTTQGEAVDIDGDGTLDIVAAASDGILVRRGRGGRQFDEEEPILAGEKVTSLLLSDLDGDGLPEVTATSGESVAVLRNLGGLQFAKPVVYPLGFVALGHRLADLDSDGALDLIAYRSDRATVLFGNPASMAFRRGDADGGGSVNLTDAVAVLLWLFAGGDPPGCLDAADANHDGAHDITDAISILSYLFLGGEAPPTPGPVTCGAPPPPSTGCERYSCR